MRRWPNGQYKYETALWAHGDAYERTSAAELTRIAAEGRLFVAVAAGDAVPVATAALRIARPCGGSGGDVDERAGRFVAVVPPEKARLRAWYTGKLGFRPVARVPVAAAYPALVAAGLHPGIVVEVLECPIAAPGVAPPADGAPPAAAERHRPLPAA